MNREQMNVQHYQQAVRFAEQFATAEKQEWLSENASRQAFEKVQFHNQHLQYSILKRPLVWGWGSLLIVLVLSMLFYWKTDRYEQMQQGKQALQTFLAQKSAEDSNQRNDHYIVNLQNQLRSNPNNGDLWFELGQAYSLNNDFEGAMICFNNAINVLGRKPTIIGAMAAAHYYKDKQTLSEQAKKWVDEALKQYPQESTSLLLLASDAFLHNNFKLAISYWEKVLESDNESINRREVIESINVADQMLQGQNLQKNQTK